MTREPAHPTSMPPLAAWLAERQIFYGWVIVGLAFLSSFAGVGLVTRSFSIVLKPLTEEMGVSRTTGILGATIASLVSGAASPFIGRIVDRSGPRTLIVVSAAIKGAVLIASAQLHNVWLFLLVFGVGTGLARPSLQAVGAQTTVAKWFVRKRGRAVTFSTLGMPLSAVVVYPLTEWMVSNFGWRSAWIALGIMVWVVLMAPIGLLMRARPEDIGLHPDGDAAAPQAAAAAAPGGRGGRFAGRGQRSAGPELSWTAQDAFRTRSFWMLTFAFTLITAVPAVLQINLYPYFTDVGLAPAAAAAANGSFGIGVIASRTLFWGYALDRFPIRVTLVLWGVLMTAVLGVMLLVNSLPLAYVGAIAFGLAMGGNAPLSTLAWSSYFGRAELGAITGLANLLSTISSVAGPLFGSVVYDLTGSYHGAFSATAIASLAGVALILLAGSPKPPPTRAAEPDGQAPLPDKETGEALPGSASPVA